MENKEQAFLLVGPVTREVEVAAGSALVLINVSEEQSALERQMIQAYVEEIRNKNPKFLANYLRFLNDYYPETPENQLSLFQGTTSEPKHDPLLGMNSNPEMSLTIGDLGLVPTWSIYQGMSHIADEKAPTFLEACLKVIENYTALPLDIDAFGRLIVEDGSPTINGTRLTSEPTELD